MRRSNDKAASALCNKCLKKRNEPHVKRTARRQQLFPCSKCTAEKRKDKFTMEGFATKVCKTCETGAKPRKRQKKEAAKSLKPVSTYFQNRCDDCEDS